VPEGLAYFERQHQRLADGTGWSFAVVAVTTDQAVGSAGLWLNRKRPATADYAVVPEFRGRGYATAALTALTGFAWTRPEIDRVELYIEPANRASVTVAERCGYREENWCPSTRDRRPVRPMLRFAASRSDAHRSTGGART
jgi:[ribosomal protein S5]-alanine N-acetyltransferase